MDTNRLPIIFTIQDLSAINYTGKPSFDNDKFIQNFW